MDPSYANNASAYEELRTTSSLAQRLARTLLFAAAISLDIQSALARIPEGGVDVVAWEIELLCWELGLSSAEEEHLYAVTRFVVSQLCSATECVLAWETSALDSPPSSLEDSISSLYIVVGRMVDSIDRDIEVSEDGRELTTGVARVVEVGRAAARGVPLPRLSRAEVEEVVVASEEVVDWVQGAVVFTKVYLCTRNTYRE